MRFANSLAILASTFIVLAVGCASGLPIRDVIGAPIMGAEGKSLSMEDVTSAIVRAGSTTGWTIQPSQTGRLIGRHSQRGGRHEAIVEIEHDTKTYSIKYRDSLNLKADTEGRTIHRAYNQWVESLDRAIRFELSQR
jgi:hypothetical protein